MAEVTNTPPGNGALVGENDFAALAPGQMIGRYQIVSILGQGGFGITYRAHDDQLHREVAIKEYLPSALAIRQDGATVLPRSTKVADDFAWGRQRFVDEGRTLATLQRAPAIVNVFDFLETNGTAYIVMELVPGHTLEERLRNGPLTPSFGASAGSIGPEYGFGLTVGDAMDDQVLLIKTAWGGKSLAEDFRPPGSGGKLGPYYSLMTEKVHKVLNNLKEYCPAYQGQGYEIVGFGWHQGWNDRIDAKKTAEYEANLVNLIKDLRTEFKVPKMPIVIGTTAMSMVDIDPTGIKLIAAQTAVAKPDKYPDFAGTVATVDTKPFDYEENSPSPGGGYHWNYSGESYYRIGVEMGHAMMNLIAK